MDNQPKEIAKGLNSPELKRNKDIPFADDFIELDHVKHDEPIRPKREKTKEIHATDLGEVHSSPDSDTIVVNTPEGTLYITLEPDSAKSSKVNSPSTQSTDLSSPSTSRAVGAEESMAMIENEKEVEQRRANLRRNSISMPTLQNLELEVLRQQAPLRSPRRKYPRRARSEFSMDEDDYSPNNSVSIPQKIRKKPTDYKLRAFVALMFLAVVFFVGFAYVLYHRQASSQAYFDALQFNEPKRLLRVLSADDVEILRASLDVHPTDCFDWSDTKTHWYGGGQASNLTWPLNIGSIDFTPFITGDIQKSQFGNVLTRYLINSKGAAVIIDEETPLHISVNKGSKQICIKAQHDNFAYANKLTDFPEMSYNICTSRT
ncbi:hypothetical protein MSG28_012101 [Choristoneura fumiferana]|uniref:Uncharacterized protein n=1 Tax=Choristoneura fumiferana TaxID=7141 RepID=A0ACC0KBN7_CHOFU|nr:hypothetical protein MSG28_012101 [Choristoneura fumiferana]